MTSRAVDTATPPYGDDDGDHSAFTHRDDDEPPPYPVDTPTPPDHVGVHRAGYREDCPACLANDAAMAATPDPSIPERPEYQPAAATRLFANGGNLPSGSIPERPAEPLDLREVLAESLHAETGDTYHAMTLTDARDIAGRMLRGVRGKSLRAALAQQSTPTDLCDCGHGSPHYARPYRLAPESRPGEGPGHWSTEKRRVWVAHPAQSTPESRDTRTDIRNHDEDGNHVP